MINNNEIFWLDWEIVHVGGKLDTGSDAVLATVSRAKTKLQTGVVDELNQRIAPKSISPDRTWIRRMPLPLHDPEGRQAYLYEIFTTKTATVKDREKTCERARLVWLLREAPESAEFTGNVIQGDEVFHLDWTSVPIHRLRNTYKPVFDNSDNVRRYLTFFCASITGEHGPFIVQRVLRAPFYDEEEDCWEASLELIYGSHVFNATMRLTEGGSVEMLDDEPAEISPGHNYQWLANLDRTVLGVLETDGKFLQITAKEFSDCLDSANPLDKLVDVLRESFKAEDLLRCHILVTGGKIQYNGAGETAEKITFSHDWNLLEMAEDRSDITIQEVRVNGMIVLDHAHLTAGLRLRGWTMQRLSVADSQINGDLELVRTNFGKLDFGEGFKESNENQSINLRHASVTGAVLLDNVNAQSMLDLVGVHSHDGLTMRNVFSGADIDLDRITITGDVQLALQEIRGLRSRGGRISGDFLLYSQTEEASSINGNVDLSGLDVKGMLGIERCSIHGMLNLWGIKVRQLQLNTCEIDGDINLVSARVESFFCRMDDDATSGVVIGGDVILSDIDARGHVEFEGVTICGHVYIISPRRIGSLFMRCAVVKHAILEKGMSGNENSHNSSFIALSPCVVRGSVILTSLRSNGVIDFSGLRCGAGGNACDNRPVQHGFAPNGAVWISNCNVEGGLRFFSHTRAEYQWNQVLRKAGPDTSIPDLSVCFPQAEIAQLKLVDCKFSGDLNLSHLRVSGQQETSGEIRLEGVHAGRLVCGASWVATDQTGLSMRTRCRQLRMEHLDCTADADLSGVCGLDSRVGAILRADHARCGADLQLCGAQLKEVSLRHASVRGNVLLGRNYCAEAPGKTVPTRIDNSIYLDSAMIRGDLVMEDVTVGGDLICTGAEIGEVRMVSTGEDPESQCRIEGALLLDGGARLGEVSIAGVCVGHDLSLQPARVERHVKIEGTGSRLCTIGGSIRAIRAEVSGSFRLAGAVIKKDLRITRAQIGFLDIGQPEQNEAISPEPVSMLNDARVWVHGIRADGLTVSGDVYFCGLEVLPPMVDGGGASVGDGMPYSGGSIDLTNGEVRGNVKFLNTIHAEQASGDVGSVVWGDLILAGCSIHGELRLDHLRVLGAVHQNQGAAVIREQIPGSCSHHTHEDDSHNHPGNLAAGAIDLTESIIRRPIGTNDTWCGRLEMRAMTCEADVDLSGLVVNGAAPWGEADGQLESREAIAIAGRRATISGALLLCSDPPYTGCTPDELLHACGKDGALSGNNGRCGRMACIGGRVELNGLQAARLRLSGRSFKGVRADEVIHRKTDDTETGPLLPARLHLPTANAATQLVVLILSLFEVATFGQITVLAFMPEWPGGPASIWSFTGWCVLVMAIVYFRAGFMTSSRWSRGILESGLPPHGRGLPMVRDVSDYKELQANYKQSARAFALWFMLGTFAMAAFAFQWLTGATPVAGWADGASMDSSGFVFVGIFVITITLARRLLHVWVANAHLLDWWNRHQCTRHGERAEGMEHADRRAALLSGITGKWRNCLETPRTILVVDAVVVGMLIAYLKMGLTIAVVSVPLAVIIVIEWCGWICRRPLEGLGQEEQARETVRLWIRRATFKDVMQVFRLRNAERRNSGDTRKSVPEESITSEQQPVDLSVERAQIGHLQIVEPIPHIIDLSNVRVDHWKINDNEPGNGYLDLLDHGEKFERSTYAQLEQAARNEGNREVAEIIHRAMRRQEQWRESRWLQTLLMLVHSLIGYGTKRAPIMRAMTIWFLFTAVWVAVEYPAVVQLAPDTSTALMEVEAGASSGTNLETQIRALRCWLDPNPAVKSQPQCSPYLTGPDWTWRLGQGLGIAIRYHIPIISWDPWPYLAPRGWLMWTYTSIVELVHWVLWPLLLASLIQTLIPRRE